MSDYTYKVGFVFAMMLHVVLVLFLLVKFTTSRPIALKSASTFINATAISEHDLSNQAVTKKEEVAKPLPPQPVVKPQPVAANIKPQIKQQVKDALQKNLLMEQAREMAELKKERQIYQKNIAKKEQQQKMQKLLQEQAKTEQKELAAEQASVQGEVDKYAVMIKQAVSSQWIKPDEVDANAFVWLLVTIAPGGVVLNVQVSSSSNNAALDRSAQAAVSKASPLPVPEDPVLFDRFRAIKLKFNSQGIVGS
ncbi:periplasmic protein TonB [Gammaproteobacteria bacterium]